MTYKDLNAGQKRRMHLTFLIFLLVGVVVLGYFCAVLCTERMHADDDWNSYLQDSPEQAELAAQLSQGATTVQVGTYVENLRQIDLKDSSFRVEFLVWFSWEGDEDLDMASNFRVYKGLMNSQKLVKEVHEGSSHYQLVQCDVTVSKSYETRRFPLESHQMRFYLESTRPVQEVMLTPDYENSGFNRNLTLTSYKFERTDLAAVTYLYESNHGDPELDDVEMNSEIVTAFEINRSGFGLYFKCFIALAGTITWVLIALFICTYHRVDPLGMIPGALFGTVSNIMVGASLLPDALEMGLLEYVNLWGVLSILAATVAIIIINRIRKSQTDQGAFAHYYGRMMFYTVLVFSIAGQILLPLMAYKF